MTAPLASNYMEGAEDSHSNDDDGTEALDEDRKIRLT